MPRTKIDPEATVCIRFLESGMTYAGAVWREGSVAVVPASMGTMSRRSQRSVYGKTMFEEIEDEEYEEIAGHPPAVPVDGKVPGTRNPGAGTKRKTAPAPPSLSTGDTGGEPDQTATSVPAPPAPTAPVDDENDEGDEDETAAILADADALAAIAEAEAEDDSTTTDEVGKLVVDALSQPSGVAEQFPVPPFAGYDDLDIDGTLEIVGDMNDVEVDYFVAYERTHRQREDILALFAIDEDD